MKFRKRPIVIEAVQWFPGPNKHEGIRNPEDPSEAYVIDIAGRRHLLNPGDWVITETDGKHHYPCNAAVFAATYEWVPDSTDAG